MAGERWNGSGLTRRALLRGSAALWSLSRSLSWPLPWLEALAPAGPKPACMLWVYVPNGIHMPAWTPEREGLFEGPLPPILEPLEGLRGDLTVISGLAHHHAQANGDGPGDHARAAAVWLTGVQPLKSEGRVGLGVSVDQVAARTLGRGSRFPSIAVGCDAGRAAGQCDSGYSCAYSGHISWSSESTPVPKTSDPGLLFDRLFRAGLGIGASREARERERRRRSVLDFVREDVRRLARGLGREDRRKLEEYETAVRELERRLALEAEGRVESVPDSARPDESAQSIAERLRLFADVLVLALRTGSTRVATFMTFNEGSNRPYRELGVSEGHHSISHHGGDGQKLEWIQRINHFHVQGLAHLLEGLAGVVEGEGRLLDRTLVVYGSNISDGNTHSHRDLPTLVAGGGGLGVRHGRHLRYPEGTPLMNLHLALCARAGAAIGRLGDSTGPLEGI